MDSLWCKGFFPSLLLITAQYLCGVTRERAVTSSRSTPNTAEEKLRGHYGARGEWIYLKASWVKWLKSTVNPDLFQTQLRTWTTNSSSSLSSLQTYGRFWKRATRVPQVCFDINFSDSKIKDSCGLLNISSTADAQWLYKTSHNTIISNILHLESTHMY